MENEVIKVKPQWETIQKRHLNKCNDIQQVVNNLIEIGLTVTSGDLSDLINNGTALYNQAEQKAKSNADIFSLPAARERFIKENTESLAKDINNAKESIIRILALNSTNPLNYEAFKIEKGHVSISATWIEELKESFTIRTTESREKALELMGNVETAIKTLNDFVSDNQNFGTGVTTFDDNRRSLVWLSEKGQINLEISNLEFI
ncbi:MAG TPA: hypothetical protein PLC80_01265 [Draconibacterium sp.]|nr:hypothetical protein [Draconibacterium sp.]